MALKFDVFIHYKEEYLKYKKCDEFFTQDLIDKFQSKKIKKIFVPADQEPKYLEYLDQALDQLAQKDVSVEEKAVFAAATMKAESENIQKNLETEAGYKNTEKRILKVVEFISKEPKSLSQMLASAGVAVDDSEHASNVSTLSLAIVTQLGETNQDELMAISVAALLHDLALKEMGFSAETSYDALDKDAKVKYRKHPQMAAEKVAGKKYITPRVLKLIEEHEEAGDGKGFPEKKKLSKLPPASQVFNACDAFDHFCINQKKLGKDAFDDFMTQKGDLYNVKILEALEKLLKS